MRKFKMECVQLFCWLIVHSVLIEGLRASEFFNKKLSRYEEVLQVVPTVINSEPSWRVADNGNLKNHPCRRDCQQGKTLTCYYYLVVHYDETMGPSCVRYLDEKYRYREGNDEYINGIKVHEFAGFDDCKYADGVKSEVMVVNGQLPGQPIEVCEGDTIVADVINSMHESTTIHWHGIHQAKTPHMDGVPHITQYPIEAGQAFRYQFEADNVGTHWWHSHTEHQRAFGLAGALVVRQAIRNNPHVKLYDFDLSDHVLLIQDIAYDFNESVPENILINGVGRKATTSNRESTTKRPTLYSTFSVTRGGRYRFRVIFNGVTNCPVGLSIDDHDLTVIASDGADIEPVKVQKLILHGGERFDFVLHANKEVNNYWIRVKGYTFCEINQLHQEAILHYAGASQVSRPRGLPIAYEYERNGITLNPIDQPPTGNPKLVNIVETNSMAQQAEPSMQLAHSYYISMGVTPHGDGLLFQMDDITFTMPRVSMLQTRNLGIGTFFCNKTQQARLGFDCRKRPCKCTNVIQVPAFQNVEFIISSYSNTAHPIHLHGYTFRVVGTGVLGADRIRQVEEIDHRTPLPRRMRGAPLKDSMQVPAFGYTIIRFYTNNPGYWILHCHISAHSENGMSMVMRVGEDVQMKMCPVSNCALCSSVL